MLAFLSLVSLASLATYVATRPMPAKEITRFQVNAPPNTVLGSVPSAGSATVSPDGTRVVFVAADHGSKAMLWVRPLDAFDAFPLAGSEGASQPFWAPDARAIGFFVANKLKRLEASGGSPYTICDVVDDIPRGASWGSGGDIVFASGSSARLYRVSADGGTPVPLATQTGQGASGEALWPSFLPDGRTFLYWARTASGGAGVYAGSIAPGAAPKRLLGGESNAAYDPAGFLLFTRGGVLLRQRFDAARLEVSGEARRVVAEGIASTESLGIAAFSVSNTGVLVFQPESGRTSQFAWFDRNGRMLETVGEPGAYRFPSLSPDGTRLLYTDLRDGSLRILDLGRNIASRVTTGGASFSAVWSPDGRTIVYRSASDNGVTAFFEKRVSVTGEPRLLLKGSLYGPTQISPDGKLLLYFGNPEGATLQDIFVLPMTGDRMPQRIVQSPSADVEPQLSPDGKFMAYVSSTTGRREVYVQPFPATGEIWPVSNTGGRQPLWRKDGQELFFVSEDRKFHAVDITLGPRFDYGLPRFLFEMRVNVYNVRNSYIPSPDGRRFLVNMALDTAAPPIHVVRNWAAGLKD